METLILIKNTFTDRWPKFKQELIPIVCLSIIQIWLNFNFPFFGRWEAPWDTLLTINACVIGVIGLVYLFSFADKHFTWHKLPPNAHVVRKIERTLPIIMFHFAWFFMWYKDSHNMPNIYYPLIYLNCLLMFALLYRAANRSPLATAETTT